MLRAVTIGVGVRTWRSKSARICAKASAPLHIVQRCKTPVIKAILVMLYTWLPLRLHINLLMVFPLAGHRPTRFRLQHLRTLQLTPL